MKREKFEKLAIEDHGHFTPDEPTKPEDSHKPVTVED